MTDFILHHYDGSPFSEKVRLVFGLKGLAWRSVVVPAVMPKPDVVALTGGHRRTPFMQIGADIYCDSSTICRAIDQRAPNPPLYPVEAAGAQRIVAQWADTTLFWTVVPYTMSPANLPYMLAGQPPEAVKVFGADRAAMTAGMRRSHPVDAAAALAGYLASIDEMLQRGAGFLLGAAPCIADFSVYHCLWFMRRAPSGAAWLEGHARITAWMQRMRAIGHGRREELSSAEAIAIAASASGHAPTEVEPDLGFSAGEAVAVSAIDYATDAVEGTLVGLSNDEVVIARTDERAGTVHVHFPRPGFHVRRAESTQK